jgi:hypothetical protein
MVKQPQQQPLHVESGKQHLTIFKRRGMLRVVWPLAFAFILTIGFITFLSNHPGEVSAQAATTTYSKSVVGVWFVNAVGAPFQPHIATFHPDGTMLIDNPESGDSHTSDSAGMGPWQVEGGNGHTVVGKFEEINADRTTHAFVSTLIVTFTITVKGDTFTGPAEANYYNPDGTLQAGPFPATLNGTRIQLP